MKIRKVALISIIIVLIIVTAGCNLVQMNPDAEKKQVVAEIEDKKITKQDFNYYLSIEKLNWKVQGQEFPTDELQLKQIKAQIFEALIENETIVYLAKQEEITVDEESAANQVEEMRDIIIEDIGGQEEYEGFLEDNNITTEEFDAFLNDYFLRNQYVQGLYEKITKDISVSEEEVKEYYEENKRFFDPSTAKAKHILANKENKELAEEIAKKAKDGEDFDKLIEEYGEREEISEAADLGEFGKAQMVTEFSDATFALEKGQTSDVVETEFGFHVIKLEEKNEEPIQEFDEVKEQLTQQLEQNAQQEEFTNYFQEKKDEIKIKKHPDKL